MIGSGLGGSAGIKTESAYGTYAAPDHFVKPQKWTIKRAQTRVQGGGFAAGQLVQDGERFVEVNQAGTGEGQLEAVTKGLGIWLQHIFGSTATPVQQSATIAYLQTHVLGNNFGQSFTGQAGVPNRLGTVYPYTGLGGKITSATFACTNNDILRVTLAIDYQQVIESQTLSAPSYVTGVIPFHWADFALKLGAFGSEAAVSGVKGFSLTLERPQSTDDYYAGAATPGTKDEPVGNDFVKVSGSLDVDFKTKADFFDRFRDNTATSMIADFKKPTAIASTFFPELAFALPQTFFPGDSPGLEGNDVVTVSVPFQGQYDNVNARAAATATYMSTDTTI